MSETSPGFDAMTSDRVGWNGPKKKLVGEMQCGIGIIEKAKEMIGAVLFEEEIVKGGIPEFPRVHQQPPDATFREIEAILPDISIFDVSILPHLRSSGNRREDIRGTRRIFLEWDRPCRQSGGTSAA